MGISRIELETDARQVQQAFESKCWEQSVVGSLISELKELVALNCTLFNLQVVPRSCNRVAHELAALGRVCSVEEALILPHLACCIQSIIIAAET